MNEAEDMHPSGSKSKGSIRVNAFNTENSESEEEIYPLKASEIKDDLRRPAKPFFRSETGLDATFVPNEDSDEEDYHSHVPKKNYIAKSYSARKKSERKSTNINIFADLYCLSIKFSVRKV